MRRRRMRSMGFLRERRPMYSRMEWDGKGVEEVGEWNRVRLWWSLMMLL